MDDSWELYCLRAGSREVISSGMILREPGTHTIGYNFWCLKNTNEAIVVDTGLSEGEAAARELTDYTTTTDALRTIGVDAGDVTRVIATHLHSDHFSAWDDFPNATFTLQGDDLDFFTGRYVKYKTLVRVAPDVPKVVEMNYAGRLDVITGDRAFAPGVEIVHVGGHTPGSQVVAVQTNDGGRLVICGDTVDLYRSMTLREPSPTASSRLDSMIAFDRILSLVGGDEARALPSHDIAIGDHAEEIAPGCYRLA